MSARNISTIFNTLSKKSFRRFYKVPSNSQFNKIPKIMSYNSPFFSFFDVINDEVDYFNRFLNSGARYQPRQQRLAANETEANANGDDRQVARSNPRNYDNRVGFTTDRFFNDLDDWFNDDYSLIPTSFNKGFVGVPVDIFDHEKNYELKITVPGVKSKKDINLEYHKEKNQIIVTGEIPSVTNEENKDNLKVRESQTGSFKRVVALPQSPPIDADNIKADYASGILTLTVPKLEPSKDEKAAVQKIEITSQDSWGTEEDEKK